MLSYAPWLAGYLVVLALVAWQVSAARERAIGLYGAPQEQSAWDEWRAAARRQSGEGEQPIEGPVQRRVPKSAEPPALVLMRDHFAVVMSAALLFSTALYIVTMILVRGILAGSPAPSSDRERG